MPDWESVRVFLELARRGSLRSAAEHLSVSLSVLRRRMEEFERQFGTPLFTRHVDGVRLTAEGEHVLSAARKMEVASFGLLRAKECVTTEIAGEVRLAVTEGTGAFWLAPRLVEFQRAYPRLLVDLKCAMTPADVTRLEADAAVQLTRPVANELKIVRLGRLHSMPFASHSYLSLYGEPRTFEDLRKHRFVLQIAEQTSTKELFEQMFPGVPWLGLVAVRTNVSSAHLSAISRGAGIGWLPTYSRLISARIVPLEVNRRFAFDIWLTYHPDAGRIARVRRLIEWIVASFDSRKFPWFADEFIHPYDLPKAYQGEPLANHFEGFIPRDAEHRSMSA